MKEKLTRTFIQAHWLFIAIAVFFGLVFTMVTPPLWGLDEPSHFMRAYQISGGHFLFEKDHKKPNIYGEYLPNNLENLFKYVKNDLLDIQPVSYDKRKDVNSTKTYDVFKNLPINDKKIFIKIIDVAKYSPIAYLPSAIGIAFSRLANFNVGDTILIARLATLTFYIAIVSYCLRLLKKTNIKWLIFVVALLPTTLFQSSTVNADSIVNTLSILLVSLIFYWLYNKSIDRRIYITILVTAALLPLTKPNYIFLSLIFPAIYFIRNKSTLLRRISISLFMSILITLPLLLWTYLASGAIGLPQQPYANASLQTHFILSNPLGFLKIWLITISRYETGYLFGIVGVLGFNQIPAPTIAEIYGFILLFIAAIMARDTKKRFEKKYSIIFLLASILSIASIYITLYLTYDPVAFQTIDGVQGRYFTPFLIFILFATIAYLPIKISMNEKTKSLFFGISTTLILIASLFYFVLVTY